LLSRIGHVFSQPSTISRAEVIAFMAKSKHRRNQKRKNRRRPVTLSKPVVWGSERAHELIHAFTQLVEERLRQTIGTSRPWTPDDYSRAMHQLREEGILNTANIVPELLRHLVVME